MAGLVLACPGHPRGWVYIMTNRPNDILYSGVTSDIGRRAREHPRRFREGFTNGVKRLVYREFYETIAAAILRESNMRHWPRAWKAQLIVNSNPGWLDLFETLNQ
jgi:putative endonuclease